MSKVVELKELNSMSIQDARAAIIKNLIEERSKIDSALKELDSELTKYEEDLNKARADGDTSENSAFDTAIDNIASTQGRLYKYQQLQRELDNVTEPTYCEATSTSNVERFVNFVSICKDRSMLCQVVEEYFNGDLTAINSKSRKELVSFCKVLDNVAQLEGDKFDLAEQEILETLKTFLRSAKPRPYVQCGVIVLYTTVRIDINGETYTLMVCPPGISFVTEGIIAADTEIGKRLLGKSDINVKQIVNAKLEFTIKEIY